MYLRRNRVRGVRGVTHFSLLLAVVSIKVEKTVDAGPMMGFNDPSGQFGDDFLRRFFGDQAPQRRTPEKYTERGQGSGFIIGEDGYILTNNHVAGDVDKMTVELQDGRTFANARLIGTDPDSEVALIKIEGVVVRVVTPGSPTAEAGIQPGDLIKSVNSQNVTSVEEFTAAVRRSQQDGRVLFLVKRGRTSQFLVVLFKRCIGR